MRTLSLALLVLCAAPTRAGVVLAFDGSRCYANPAGNEYWLTGTGMAAPRQQLLAAGHTIVTTGLLTPQQLQGVDVFVSGALQPGTALAPSEADALAAWIAAGGGAYLMGENDALAAANAQYGALCNGVSYLGQLDGSGMALTITAPAHPLIQGPAGAVSTIDGMNLCGRFGTLPASATCVGANPDGSAGLLAVALGAGRVVLANDTGYCSVPWTYTNDHAVLWDNAIAWLLGLSGGTVFCAGDGTASACPCGNLGAAAAGCAHSLGVGAVLGATGQASVGNDTLVLQGAQMPDAPALYFQGTQRLAGGTGVAFGDGLRCAGGTITRLATRQNVQGASSYPGPGDAPVSVRGGCAAGDVRTYQVWYRNAAAFCTASTFNLSNGLEVGWGA